MDIVRLYKAYQECGLEVCTDTRKITPGSMFFALSGANFNGNQFIQKALDNGCLFAVSDDNSIIGDNIINVSDCLQALQDLANYHRKQFNIPVLAITGSNGKTTTKELLAEVLLQKYNLLYTQGNFNNHIGVPLTLLKLREDHNFALIEMGANKPFDIKELCEIAEPNYGMITNIGTAHIEGFGSREGVVETKSEMYDFIVKNSGLLFVNNNEAYLKPLLNGYANIREFGDGSGLNFQLDSSKYELELEIEGEIIKTNLFGKYNANNVLTAYAVGLEFGIEKALIIQALEEYQPNNNRSQIKVTAKGNQLILDAYNANPSSLNLAIDELLSKNGEKVFIVGDMKELGTVSKEEHQLIIEKLVDAGSRAFLIGEEFSKYNTSALLNFNSVDEFLESKALDSLTNVQILIKGSRSIQLEKVVPYL